MILLSSIDEALRRLVKAYNPLQMYLHGYYACETPNEESTWDVLIVVESSDKSIMERGYLASEVLFGLRIPAHITVYTKEEFDTYSQDVYSVTYEAKTTGKILYDRSLGIPNITIRLFDKADIPTIVSSFAQHNWPKPPAVFETYLQEQQAGERFVWVAHVNGEFAGYVTLTWQSKYQPFRDSNIPEIMDLNVLPPFRNYGVGARLLETAEVAVNSKGKIVGIGVGLYDGYGAAQRLYVKRGYIPDGRGITYNYKPVAYGEKVPLDDDLVLWFIKEIKFFYGQ